MRLNLVVKLDESWDSYKSRPLSELLDKLLGQLTEVDGVKVNVTSIIG